MRIALGASPRRPLSHALIVLVFARLSSEACDGNHNPASLMSVNRPGVGQFLAFFPGRDVVMRTVFALSMAVASITFGAAAMADDSGGAKRPNVQLADDSGGAKRPNVWLA